MNSIAQDIEGDYHRIAAVSAEDGPSSRRSPQQTRQAHAAWHDEKNLTMLREAFELFDLDGGGSIEAPELHTLLDGLGIKVTQQEAMDLVHEVDSDGSGDTAQPQPRPQPQNALCAPTATSLLFPNMDHNPSPHLASRRHRVR